MCNKIAGELLMCFHQNDQAAHRLLEDILNNKIAHVQVIENLPQRLSRVALKIRPDLEFRFYKLRVPPGEEEWKINYLQFFYKHAVLEAITNGQMDRDVLNWSNLHLQVVPHSVLSITMPAPSAFGTINLTKMHSIYSQMIGPKLPSGHATGLKLLIFDTGIASNITHNTSESRNFVDTAQPKDVSDDNGHGSAVATIISDLCPLADLIIYKVADNNGRASEWDTLAALAATNQAKVINMSLAFGLDDITCPTCGRESQSSRSAVFENLITQVEKSMGGALIVAAAGNRKKRELSFPARFASVLAIESVDSLGNLSEFTNRSTIDQEGNSHPNVFVLPGGQKDKNNNITECSVETSLGKKYCGTSFAAAYASAILATSWSDPAHNSKNNKQIVDYLRVNADKNLPNYDPSIHGNGLMRIP